MKKTVFVIAFILYVLLPPTALAQNQRWTLERAVSKALADNPEAAIAQHRMDAARAGIRQAEAAFWPQVQLSTSYNRTNNPMYAFGSILNQRAFNQTIDFNHPGDIDDLNAQASVNLMLYNGGRNVAGRQAALISAEAVAQGANVVRNQIRFEVARAFHSLVKAKKLEDAADAAVHALEANLKSAENLFTAGSVLKSTVLDVGVQLQRAKEDKAKARNGVKLASKALAILLAIPDQTIETEAGNIDYQLPDPLVYSRHPELLAAQSKVKASQTAVRLAYGGHLPQIGAYASLNEDKGWETGDSGESWGAGVMLKLNIFDGMATSAKIDQATSELAAAREDERKVRLKLDLELEQAQLSLDEALERQKVTRESVTQAEESAQLTRARFAQGAATSTETINAEAALLGARVRRSEAEADEQIARAALCKAVGCEG